jgi:hypothetical protein
MEDMERMSKLVGLMMLESEINCGDSSLRIKIGPGS